MKILITQLGAIGDMILLTPMIGAINNKYPGAEIHILASILNYMVIENDKRISKIIVYEKTPVKFLKTIMSVRKEKYDFYIDPMRFRIQLPSSILKLFIKFIPKPDLIICLYGDPQVICSRKMELPLEEAERQIEMLKSFAKQEPNAVLISTEKSIEASRDEILQAFRNCC